jgi:hypothetical protein
LRRRERGEGFSLVPKVSFLSFPRSPWERTFPKL